MRIARATFAALAGSLLALGLYLAWFFQITHHDTPWDGAPVGFMVLTGLVAALCGLAGGYVGALLAPATPRGTADAIAAVIAVAAAFAETHTPGQHHYAQALALLVAAPAAYLAGRLHRPVPHVAA